MPDFDPPAPDELSRQLARIRERRGYLLPHHGLLVMTSPAMLETYDELYAAFALTPGTLSRHDHEALWLAILTVNQQPVASHHVARFREHAGSMATFEAVVALSALTSGFPCWRFVAQHWQAHLPDFEARSAWLAAFRGVAAPLPGRLAHLVAIVVLICRDAWDGLAWQLVAAYADGVPEQEIAEAITLTMLPSGVPRLVDAARVWKEVILRGDVEASPGFLSWAQTAGQGGYDEAVGALADAANTSASRPPAR
jgi:alkylhydroperoxidase/carboxymuconolactone decarboxylase family protein YurZ